MVSFPPQLIDTNDEDDDDTIIHHYHTMSRPSFNAFLPSSRRRHYRCLLGILIISQEGATMAISSHRSLCRSIDVSRAGRTLLSLRASRAGSESVFTFIRPLGRAPSRSSLLDYASLDFFPSHQQAQESVGVQSSISYSAELTANTSIDVVERGSSSRG